MDVSSSALSQRIRAPARPGLSPTSCTPASYRLPGARRTFLLPAHPVRCTHRNLGSRKIVAAHREDASKLAVVIGAGPVGLASAAALASRGWKVSIHLIQQQRKASPFFPSCYLFVLLCAERTRRGGVLSQLGPRATSGAHNTTNFPYHSCVAGFIYPIAIKLRALWMLQPVGELPLPGPVHRWMCWRGAPTLRRTTKLSLCEPTRCQ